LFYQTYNAHLHEIVLLIFLIKILCVFNSSEGIRLSFFAPKAANMNSARTLLHTLVYQYPSFVVAAVVFNPKEFAKSLQNVA